MREGERSWASRSHLCERWYNGPGLLFGDGHLSRASRKLLFRVGRHWGSWTRQVEPGQDSVMRDVHRALRWSYVILETDGLVTVSGLNQVA